MSKEINKNINKMAQCKSSIAVIDSKSSIESVAIDKHTTRYPGEEVRRKLYGTSKKGVRTFIFEGMKDNDQSLQIMERLITDCSLVFVWDHVALSIRKMDRTDGKADFAIDTLRTDVPWLRRISQLLKMAGAVDRVYEDILQHENVLA